MKSIIDSVADILSEKRKEKIKLDKDYDDLFNLNLCDECNKCVANLCDECNKCVATCNGDPVFGLGQGCDNVVRCDRFYPIWF